MIGSVQRRLFIGVALCAVIIGSGVSAVAGAGDAGYVGPSFAGAVSAPSGEKPQHKLWFHDGAWWAHLYSPVYSTYRIFRLDAATATWVDTGTSTDSRKGTKADVLWDGSHLVIASHGWTKNAGALTNGTKLFRFSYDQTTRRFVPDAGFPVTLSHYKSETLSIDRDSTGRLWATWTAAGKVLVAATTGNDASWSAPFALPVPHSVTSDDISALVAFGGRIGVMWSDQSNDLFGFAIHADGASPLTGWSAETAHQSPDGSDDHLNLKKDASGNVYAAVKTSLTGSGQTLTAILRRTPGGTWTYHPVSTVAEGQTRPILLLDEAAGQAHVYATTPESGGSIVRKSAPLGTLAFGGGATTVIRIESDLTANNPSSTRQSVSAATGRVVLGSTANTLQSQRYVFSMEGLGTPEPTGSPTATPTPTVTPTPTPIATASPTPTPTATASAPPTPSPTASPSPTPSPTGSPGASATLEPEADAFVYSGNTTRNYGTDAALRLRQGTTASPYTWRSYLSFDLSGVANPTQAVLRLWVTDKGANASVWRVDPFYAGSSTPWTELGITWTNAPLVTGDPLDTAEPVSAGGWIELDVSDALDASGRLDLALQTTTTDSILFSSRDGATPPELVVSGG